MSFWTTDAAAYFDDSAVASSKPSKASQLGRTLDTLDGLDACRAKVAVPQEPGPGAGAEVWRSWRRSLLVLYQPHGQQEAGEMAQAALENRWLLLHPEPVDPNRCAGCCEPVGARSVMQLACGARIHGDNDFECLVRYGARWRRQAAARLAAFMGDG